MTSAIEADFHAPDATSLTGAAARRMSGGKAIADGDRVFLFDGETYGGAGLVATGIGTRAEAVPPTPGIVGQPPLVTVAIDCRALAQAPLGREQLKRFSDWDDGKPETELNFELYRQATDKIVGLTETTAHFHDGYF